MEVRVRPWIPRNKPCEKLSLVHFELNLILAQQEAEVNESKTLAIIKKILLNHTLNVGQALCFDYEGVGIKLLVQRCVALAEGDEIVNAINFGIFTDFTRISVEPAKNKRLNYQCCDDDRGERLVFDCKEMRIGGLDHEFDAIFRRAFVSRTIPSHIMEQMGRKHVKGILLYGPPGTGKTLIARQIGKRLTKVEPIIVNGPEVMNKYVGTSEENIRKLFIPAEIDYKQNKAKANLHLIIFDEIDAICKARGGGGGGINNSTIRILTRTTHIGTGVHDTMVNQLLTKIDGVDTLPNILVIGLTNRKDLIDSALLRPGRLEVQIEIG
jgi:vesicle-fusing ATPase